jgi:hypothetical protein
MSIRSTFKEFYSLLYDQSFLKTQKNFNSSAQACNKLHWTDTHQNQICLSAFGVDLLNTNFNNLRSAVWKMKHADGHDLS